MGGTLQFRASVWTLAATLVLGVVSGILARVAAAWQCARLPLSEATVAT